MTARTVFGMGLAVILFGIFGYFVHKGCAFNAAAGWAFGGGLLFCGVLIDPADFMTVLNAVRGTSNYPPPPGGKP